MLLRLLRVAALTLLVLLVITAAGVIWLGSEAGRESALSLVRKAAGAAGVSVAMEGSQGALGKRLSIERLTITNEQTVAVIRQLVLAWRPSALLSGRIDVETLTVRELDVLLPPPAPPSKVLPTRPTVPSLVLPLEASVTQLAVDRIRVRTKSSVDAGAGSVAGVNREASTEASTETIPDSSRRVKPEAGGLNADDDSGIVLDGLRARLNINAEQLEVSGLAVRTPWGQVSGVDGSVGTGAPHSISLRGRFDRIVEQSPVRLSLRANGDAERIAARLRGITVGAQIESEWLVRPLRAMPAISGNVALTALDLRRIDASLPQTALNIELALDNLQQANGLVGGDARPMLQRFAGTLSVDNGMAGSLVDGALPLASLTGEWRVELAEAMAQSRVALSDMTASLIGTGGAQGSVRGSLETMLAPTVAVGPFKIPQALASLRFGQIDVAMFSAAPPTSLSGSLDLSGRVVRVDLAQKPGSLEVEGLEALRNGAELSLHARLEADRIDLGRLQVAIGDSALRAAGAIGLASPYQTAFSGQLHRVRPAVWLPKQWPDGENWRDSELNAGFAVQSEIGAQSSSFITLNISRSRLAARPLSGLIQGRAQLAELSDLAHLDALDIDLRHGRDSWRASGALGKPTDELAIDVNLTDLKALIPSLNGDLALRAKVQGEIGSPRLDVNLRSKRFALKQAEQSVQIAGLSANYAGPVTRAAFDRAKVSADVAVRRVEASGQRFERINVALSGSMAKHRLSIDGRSHGYRLRTGFDGRLTLAPSDFTAPVWQGALAGTRVDGKLAVRQRGQARLDLGTKRISLAAMDVALADGRIKIEQLQRDSETGQISAQADWQSLALRRLLAPAGIELPGEVPMLRLSGSADVSGSRVDNLDGRLSLNIAEAGNKGRILGGRNRLELKLNQGQMDGQAELTVPSLAFTRRWSGPDWQLDGGLSVVGDITGPIAAPKVSARISGRDLSLLQPTMGWRLENGSLLATLDDRSMRIERLRLQSGDGDMTLSGQARLLDGNTGRNPGALPLVGRFELASNAIELPLGPGQRIVLSGSTRFDADRKGMRLSGSMRADRGLIEIASSGAPTLPDDIAITDSTASAQRPRKAPSPAAAPGNTPETEGPQISSNLNVDLGDQLRVLGAGIDARLGGELRIAGTLPADPVVTGNVKLIEGAYTAYGQDLKVTRGNIRFNGPIDNPILDLVATRPKLPVEVGVSITGTALNPVIELFSAQQLSDAEKLSWLVLGAGLDDAPSAAQSLALQQAALTLVGRDDGSISGGGLAEKLGLENIGLGYASATGQQEVVSDSGAPTGLPGAGAQSSTNSRDEVVTLAKRLSSNILVSYEQGVRGVWNLLRVQYEINDRLSLRAQTGSDSALDLLYFFSFD